MTNSLPPSSDTLPSDKITPRGKQYGRPGQLAVSGLVLLGLVWGMFFSLSRVAGETGVDPVVLVAYIIVAEIPFFLLICWLRGRYPRLLRWRSMLFYLVGMILGYGVPAVLELSSAPIIGAGLLTIFVSLTPIITVILTLLLRTEPLQWRKVAGVVLGTVALAPIVLREDISVPVPELALLGFTLAFMVACCYALYHNVVAKYWPEGEDTWQLATGETIAGIIIFVPVTLIFYGLQPINLTEVSILMLFIGYMTLSMTSIYLYFYLLKEGGPIFVSTAGFISLASGVIFGMVFFGETHPQWIMLCMLGMVGAIWLTSSDNDQDAGE